MVPLYISKKRYQEQSQLHWELNNPKLDKVKVIGLSEESGKK